MNVITDFAVRYQTAIYTNTLIAGVVAHMVATFCCWFRQRQLIEDRKKNPGVAFFGAFSIRRRFEGLLYFLNIFRFDANDGIFRACVIFWRASGFFVFGVFALFCLIGYHRL